MASRPSNLLPQSPFDINGLRVFVPGQQGFQPLQPGSALFDCTASIISLALDLLECRSSVMALKAATRGIVEANRDVPDLRDLPDSAFEPKVHEYLRSIRHSFPHVVITDELGMATKNGRTNKQDCSGAFEPKTAAVIEINETVGSPCALPVFSKDADTTFEVDDSDGRRL